MSTPRKCTCGATYDHMEATVMANQQVEHRVWQGRNVKLVEGSRTDSDPSHESAEEMWESLGSHVDWESEDDSGQVAHPVCTVEQLDTMTDAQILAAVAGDVCAEERDAIEGAIEYARTALDDMRSIESSLAAAVDAWELGDLRATIEHLDAARREEGDYGDSPAADALADDLLEDVESLALLLAEPATCDHIKQNRGRYAISKTSRCGGNVAGVIVYKRTFPWPHLPFGHQGAQGRAYGYDYVCAVHLRHSRHAAPDVIDTIEFTKAARDRIRKAKAKRDAEWSAECRRRDEIDEENERRAAQGLPALEGGWKR